MRRSFIQPLRAHAPLSLWGGVALGALLCLGGCGAEGAEAFGDRGEPGYDSGASWDGVGPEGGSGGAGGSGGGLPPEEEVDDLAFSQPAAGAQHVWLASPGNDLVVRVDAQTRAVGTVAVGEEPTIVRALPGRDVAFALSRGADELAVITHSAGGDDLQIFPLPGHFNRLDLDPQGDFAFLWFDVQDTRFWESSADQQLLAVFDVATRSLSKVTVGFRPRQLVFRGAQVLVVTDDGLSVVQPRGLPADSVAPLVPLVQDPLLRVNREVLISEDARFAVSRGPDEAGLTVVRLPDGEPEFVPLPEVPTDIDLLASGDGALVMLRGQRALARVDLETLDEPRIVPIELGQPGAAVLPATGSTAVLYTTVDPAGEGTVIVLYDLDSDAMRPVLVRKAIDGVSIDPAGRVAFLRHRRLSGSPHPSADADTQLAYSDGYTLLDLETGFARLVTTPAQPIGLLYDEGAPRAFVLTGPKREALGAVHRLDLSSLSVHSWLLGSPPEVVGLLPSVQRAFVTQTHPSGRISFIDLQNTDADLQTVSGYTLNSRIE